ncbi:serine--tRNA ligase [Mycoplasmatota bacterium]|nr:serine--tRNA ligase [Mycoplasmatota bacterium]
MLDIKLLRDNHSEIIKRLEMRNKDFSYLRDVVEWDKEVRVIKTNVEELKAKRNETSKRIGQYKREGKDVSKVMESIANIGNDIKVLDDKKQELSNKINEALLNTPNVPHVDAIQGVDETMNKEMRKYLEATEFDFEPKPHWDLAVELDILDFDRGAKIAGSRFTVYKGLGARLERALYAFMMDIHAIDNGYIEIIPPYIVNSDSLYATGQLPKFADDLFKLEVEDKQYYLNPTAEVPTINLHRDEILDGQKLPLKYVSFTTAFRKEAGSAGRDTRGIIRQHQFNKVELIRFCLPEQGYDMLEEMLLDSEKILKLLQLPYRVVELCTGDLGASMAKTYDLEVWLPSYNNYKEIASISNAETYQARRANIRFKRNESSKPELVHTLNGSGLAIGRTVVAILENYQQKDGSVLIPKVLIPYMNCDIIRKRG